MTKLLGMVKESWEVSKILTVCLIIMIVGLVVLAICGTVLIINVCNGYTPNTIYTPHVTPVVIPHIM